MTNSDLDSAVATALGHQVLGLHWACPNGDGMWVPCPAGREHAELRPMLVGPGCTCAETLDEPDELYEEMYGFARFNGHLPHCVTVAPRYSTDPAAMMLVLEWMQEEWTNRLVMSQEHDQWNCRRMSYGGQLIEATADTLPTAVALAAVRWAERGK